MFFGDYEFTRNFIKVLLEACKASFFFSHRMLWFVKSTDFALLDQPSIDPAQ